MKKTRWQMDTDYSYYKIMFETMNEGAITLASDGTILYCNQRFADIVKKPLEKVVRSSIYQYIPSADLQLFETLIQRSLNENSKLELALLNEDKNAVPAFFSMSALPITDIPDVVSMIVIDLTEQKRNEKILAEEKLINQILFQTAEIFVICDDHGCIIRSSCSTYTLFGRNPIYEPFDDAFHLLNQDGTPFVLLSAMSGRLPQAMEVVFKNGDNQFLSFLLSADPLIHDGDVLGIVVVMVDITERQKLEEALKVSEIRYRRLFETALDGILILNAKTGKISDVNPFLVEMLGYSHEDFLGKKLWEIGAFKDIEASQSAFAELQSKGYVRYHDLPLETKDGRAMAVEFISNVYHVNNDKVIQCNIRDITDRKMIANALQKAHDEMEQRVEERTIELRTALFEIEKMKDRLEAENIYFRQEIKSKRRFDDIVGESDGLRYVLYRAEQVASTDTTILILGETGTGKELIAAAIHDMSPRKARPMITVNCAALPANLIESELFGREKGAFTGADTRQIGRFEIADGSTLCLDEIGELPLDMQAKLLRVIQHNEFERLGSSRTIKVNTRIVATTNRNLEEEVRKGRFRQDLYYRLNVFPITVPPLRQRKEDIPLLVQSFVNRYARKLGKQITSINVATMKALQNYPWPGNIRELESVVERTAILCPGPVFELADKLEISSLPSSSSMETLEEMERNQILKALLETRWRIEGKDGAAAILGLHPSTLRARLHKLGIRRPEIKESD